MKSLSAIVLLAASLASSAQADLTIACDVFSRGANTSTCQARISSPYGTGETKIGPDQKYAFSSNEKCEMGVFDVFVQNMTPAFMTPATASYEVKKANEDYQRAMQVSFKISLVKYKNRKKKKTKRLVSDVIPDTAYGKIGGKLQSITNGNGLECRISN